MRVLLSINPEHVDNIIQGIKIFEFRRKIFARKDVKTVVIYCTRPVGQIVAEFDIEDVLEDEPEALWASTSQGSGISKDFFDSYFAGREKAFALKIGALRVFNPPICPHEMFENFTPPQSYKYVPSQDEKKRPQYELL